MQLPRPVVLALVAIGGAAGTLIRYAAGREWPTAARDFPWTTFAVNLAGGLLLGLLVAATRRPRPSNPWRRPLIGTGLLGGMTTFDDGGRGRPADRARPRTHCGGVPRGERAARCGRRLRRHAGDAVTPVAIALAGAAGAVARYLVDDAVTRRARTPAGTFVVNITGCVLLGVVVGRTTGDTRTVLGTGFLGAYTTFSAYAVQVVELAPADRTKAAFYAIGSIVVGTAAAALGIAHANRF